MTSRLYIGGLTNPSVGAAALAQFLLSLRIFHRVLSVDLVADPSTGVPRGFAFCQVQWQSVAQKARRSVEAEEEEEEEEDDQLLSLLKRYNGTTWKKCKLRFGRAKETYKVRLQREWDAEAKLTEEQEEHRRRIQQLMTEQRQEMTQWFLEETKELAIRVNTTSAFMGTCGS